MFTDIYPVSDVGPVLAAITAVCTSLAMLSLAVVSLTRAHRRKRLAAKAAAMLDPSHALRAGGLREGEILLSGVVEHADDHDVAVRVDVVQHGTESESSGTWSYSWSEVDRKIVVKPFYLELADGTRVRVLAPPNVEVADELDQKVLISRDHRVMSAELIPGEALHAQGWLERGSILKPGGETGYRDAEYEWQLVPARGRMLLSSEPLGAGLESRAAFHRKYGRAGLVLFAMLQLLFANYYARVLGSDHVATLAAKHHSTYLDSDNDTVDRYDLLVNIGNEAREVQVDSDDFVRVVKGDHIAFRRGILGWDIGGGGSLFLVTFGLAWFMTFCTLIVYRVFRTSSRPWFRRKVSNSGTGKLPGD